MSEATATKRHKTEVGNYFVSNYPPFSFWSPDRISEATDALNREPDPDTPLGLYLHIPFCRKRCHFCYFRVYTGKKSQEIRDYTDRAIEELTMYSKMPFIGGRKPKFVYFGGGTPSYLSTDQLRKLTDEMKALMPWDEAEEVTFECEPGTLTEKKLRVLGEIGITRLSLGVENFDPHILELNGRAHLGKEIDRAYDIAKDVGFPQINIDLIAGMMDETDDNWTRCIEKAIEMEPDSITIYQMEIPFNTTIYQRMRDEGKLTAPVADWETKRRWVAEGFEALEAAGYDVGSAYTAVRSSKKTKFVYRDELWAGADLIGAGVASFGHVNGTHFQNEHNIGAYGERVAKGELPIYRAFTPSNEERLIREMVLQLKLGHINIDYFNQKFGVDITEHFSESFQELTEDGYLSRSNGDLVLSRDGLLSVDSLLHGFFLPEHQNARYA
ncbi:MAG: oxygen-independent coproporphyrinogen-3 oxidase [Rhodothermales bacterium]|jgi:oxygen-independent coproporphyrinogen-3 oxidase